MVALFPPVVAEKKKDKTDKKKKKKGDTIRTNATAAQADRLVPNRLFSWLGGSNQCTPLQVGSDSVRVHQHCTCLFETNQGSVFLTTRVRVY